MVSTSLIKPVGSFGTSVSILLAASSSRCFLLFLPTQKNFDGLGNWGQEFSPATVAAPLVMAILTVVAGTARCSAFAAATTSTMSSPRTIPNRGADDAS